MKKLLLSVMLALCLPFAALAQDDTREMYTVFTEADSTLTFYYDDQKGTREGSETKTPYMGGKKSTVLGVHEGTAYVLLYNGILKDRSVNGGNVLTRKTLEVIQADLAAATSAALPYEKIVVYGEACRLMAPTLEALKIEFRQTPYDLVTRR